MQILWERGSRTEVAGSQALHYIPHWLFLVLQEHLQIPAARSSLTVPWLDVHLAGKASFYAEITERLSWFVFVLDTAWEAL